MPTPKWTLESTEALLKRIADGNAEGRQDLRRRRIIEAATELFVEQGYRKVTIEEIARRAGVAKGTVYLYAKSKAELLMLALVLEKLRHRDVITAVLDPKVPARDRMRLYIETMLLAPVQVPLYARVLNGDADLVLALNEVSPSPGEQPGEFNTSFIEQLLEEMSGSALSKKERKDRAKALLLLGFFAAKLADPRLRQGLSPERIAELLANMIVDDIAAPVRRKS